MAAHIAADYRGQRVVVMGVMTGSFVVLSDLIRLFDFPVRVGVVWAHSYRGPTTTRGELQIDVSMMPDVGQEHVLLVDDIFDTGHTLKGLIEVIANHDPISVRSAVLLRKQGRQEVALTPDYVGFEIPDEFVVGYGLDYEDHYRHLPYLAALDGDDLSSVAQRRT